MRFIWMSAAGLAASLACVCVTAGAEPALAPTLKQASVKKVTAKRAAVAPGSDSASRIVVSAARLSPAQQAEKDYQEALISYDAGDGARAQELLAKAAEMGSAKAGNELALLMAIRGDSAAALERLSQLERRGELTLAGFGLMVRLTRQFKGEASALQALERNGRFSNELDYALYAGALNLSLANGARAVAIYDEAIERFGPSVATLTGSIVARILTDDTRGAARLLAQLEKMDASDRLKTLLRKKLAALGPGPQH